MEVIGNSLLIGNGLNRCSQKKNVEWNAVLYSILEHFGFTDVKDIYFDSYPLKFEYIMNTINSDENNSSTPIDNYRLAKEFVIKYLDDNLGNLHSEFSEAIKGLNLNSILTTNYDLSIEKTFNTYKYTKTAREQFKSNSENRRLITNPTSTLSHIRFYHVHGIDAEPESICLGYEQYSMILSELRKRLTSDDSSGRDRIIMYLNNETPARKEDYINAEFETRFFDTNMAILGLGLEAQEIDIWWLLCYRAYLYYSNKDQARELIKNTITYYDVHPIRKTDKGYLYEDDYVEHQKEKFSKMRVNYVPLPVKGIEYKEKYLEALAMIKKDFSTQ